MRQFSEQDRRLQRVESEVPTDILVEILWLGAVVTHEHKALVKMLIISDDHTAITGTSEVFARVEAEAAARADAACLPAFVRCSDGLGGVLDHLKPMAIRD